MFEAFFLKALHFAEGCVISPTRYTSKSNAVHHVQLISAEMHSCVFSSEQKSVFLPFCIANWEKKKIRRAEFKKKKEFETKEMLM